MPDPVTVKLPNLDGRDAIVTLALPTSIARRWTVVHLAPRSTLVAGAAALGICWGSPRGLAPKVLWVSDPGAYGEAVFDALLDRGVQSHDLYEAGVQALVFLAASVGGTAEEEVSAAEDFSGAPKGA